MNNYSFCYSKNGMINVIILNEERITEEVMQKVLLIVFSNMAANSLSLKTKLLELKKAGNPTTIFFAGLDYQPQRFEFMKQSILRYFPECNFESLANLSFNSKAETQNTKEYQDNVPADGVKVQNNNGTYTITNNDDAGNHFVRIFSDDNQLVQSTKESSSNKEVTFFDQNQRRVVEFWNQSELTQKDFLNSDEDLLIRANLRGQKAQVQIDDANNTPFSEEYNTQNKKNKMIQSVYDGSDLNYYYTDYSTNREYDDLYHLLKDVFNAELFKNTEVFVDQQHIVQFSQVFNDVTLHQY